MWGIPMINQEENINSSENAVPKQDYAAPAVLSVVKVTDVVRGGTGFSSDGGNFLPL
jgi:hypothetical protein